MIELGHPWIIADATTAKWPAGQAGELVELVDAQGHFLAMALLDPAERIVARIVSRQKMKLDGSWLKKRLERAVALRSSHVALADSDAYRLVNAEGDGLPGLTVDRYGDYLMVQLYGNCWQPHLALLARSLQELLQPRGIYEKTRPKNTRELESVYEFKSYGRLIAGSAAPAKLPVTENGLTFLVSLEKGLNTGLFLDQRNSRRELMTRIAGKRFLNLFSYTGAFSVAAAAAGARFVTSVDASLGYMEWAKENFGSNRLNPRKHEFIVAEVLSALAALARKGELYDVVLMDPPSFSTVAKSRFTTRGGTADLVAAALPLLAEGGLLICSSNHQKVDLADYLKELRRGALKAESQLQVISLTGQPEDFPYPVTFPEGRYLKYAVCVKTTG
jgi:23S rRNA (cytosine1962-C5)-methyltransferase